MQDQALGSAPHDHAAHLDGAASHDHAAHLERAAHLEPADFDAMRVGYGQHERLDVADLEDGWLPLFAAWLEEAGRRGVREPNAMVLGTATPEGRPSTRTVLCKGADERGVRFFTTTTSRKGSQLAASGFASVTFPWLTVERQVHLEGPCHPLSREESLAYWRTRPRGSQVAAWASEQSRPAASVAELERLYAEAAERFSGDGVLGGGAADERFSGDGGVGASVVSASAADEVPMPDRWGGYLLTPERVEFWQGGRDRFHDRVECRLSDGEWSVTRLQP